jgi:hypothetical protein
VVARLEAGHAGPDFEHDAGAFVPEDRGEQPLGVSARQRERVGVADAGRPDLDQHLSPAFGAFEIELDDLEGLFLAANATAARVFITRFPVPCRAP